VAVSSELTKRRGSFQIFRPNGEATFNCNVYRLDFFFYPIRRVRWASASTRDLWLFHEIEDGGIRRLSINVRRRYILTNTL